MTQYTSEDAERDQRRFAREGIEVDAAKVAQLRKAFDDYHRLIGSSEQEQQENWERTLRVAVVKKNMDGVADPVGDLKGGYEGLTNRLSNMRAEFDTLHADDREHNRAKYDEDWKKELERVGLRADYGIVPIDAVDHRDAAAIEQNTARLRATNERNRPLTSNIVPIGEQMGRIEREVRLLTEEGGYPPDRAREVIGNDRRQVRDDLREDFERLNAAQPGPEAAAVIDEINRKLENMRAGLVARREEFRVVHEQFLRDEESRGVSDPQLRESHWRMFSEDNDIRHMSGKDLKKLADELQHEADARFANARQTARVTEEPGRPNGPATAGGVVVGAGQTADGQSVTIKRDNGRLFAEDADGNRLRADVEITATIIPPGGSAQDAVTARYQVSAVDCHLQPSTTPAGQGNAVAAER